MIDSFSQRGNNLRFQGPKDSGSNYESWKLASAHTNLEKFSVFLPRCSPFPWRRSSFPASNDSNTRFTAASTQAEPTKNWVPRPSRPSFKLSLRIRIFALDQVQANVRQAWRGVPSSPFRSLAWRQHWGTNRADWEGVCRFDSRSKPGSIRDRAIWPNAWLEAYERHW